MAARQLPGRLLEGTGNCAPRGMTVAMPSARAEWYRTRLIVPIKHEKMTPKEALRKEVSPSAFVVSRNDWIVGKINHIGGLQNGKVHLQRAERALV